MPQAGLCICVTTAETSGRKCPNCGDIEPLAVPFSKTGKEHRVCPKHDKPVPILTTLSASVGQHDSRGYTACRCCGWVFEEFRSEVGSFANDHRVRYDPNHYARLMRAQVGALPRVYGKSGRFDKLVLGKTAQRQLSRDAATLEIAEAFASHSEFTLELKDAFMSAVAAFYALPSPKQRRPLREAVFVCIAEALCSAWRWERFDSAKSATAFQVSQAQLDLARKSVQRWFETYWKGDKRQ